jgi:hypothetical protein
MRDYLWVCVFNAILNLFAAIAAHSNSKLEDLENRSKFNSIKPGSCTDAQETGE